MIHKEELERILSVMRENRENLENELKNFPEGVLYTQVKLGKRYYYELFPKKGNRKKARRYGISNDDERIMALVRKKYVEAALRIIDKDIDVIKMAIKHYKPYDENVVMKEFAEKYPELTEGIYYRAQKDEDWAKSFGEQNDFRKEDKKHVSLKGETMRSKNEIYIASRLDHYGIPYIYEGKADHPDVERLPDFKIKRPRDGKIIYWEHLGMTDSDGYLSGNELKLTEYEEADIAPWDNLIITYDKPDGSIDARIIEGMIIGWLL